MYLISHLMNRWNASRMKKGQNYIQYAPSMNNVYSINYIKCIFSILRIVSKIVYLCIFYDDFSCAN